MHFNSNASVTFLIAETMYLNLKVQRGKLYCSTQCVEVSVCGCLAPRQNGMSEWKLSIAADGSKTANSEVAKQSVVTVAFFLSLYSIHSMSV